MVSSESSSPPRKSARVAAGKVEDTKDSGFAQYCDKEKKVYITVKKDGASKEHPVSKGPNA